MERYISHISARNFNLLQVVAKRKPDHNPEDLRSTVITVQDIIKRPGFAVLMKYLLGKDPYQTILFGTRLKFFGGQASADGEKIRLQIQFQYQYV